MPVLPGYDTWIIHVSLGHASPSRGKPLESGFMVPSGGNTKQPSFTISAGYGVGKGKKQAKRTTQGIWCVWRDVLMRAGIQERDSVDCV